MVEAHPKLSLYIPAFNAEQHIARCVCSVLAQTSPLDEVLIVDDGSNDRTADIAGAYPVRLIKHEVNRGIAAARNTGLRNARNGLVASLDSDCVAEPDWLERLVAHFQGNRTALVGGRLEEAVQRTAADRFRKLHLRQNWGQKPTDSPPFVYGSNTLARRDAIAAAGWYDERFRTNYEDVDISQRLRARGYDLYYESSAIVRHLKEDDDLSVLRALWRYGRIGYRRRISLPIVLGHVAYNTKMSFQFLRADWRTEDWGVLRLDLSLPVRFAIWDWRLWRET
jgi:GT2 family glycosyltransferase